LERGATDGQAELVWGEIGITPGKLQKPRAAAIDAADQVYLVDMTARIQVYDPLGNYLRGWQTPESKNGRPSGLSFNNEGLLLVADTHYYRVLFYTPEGRLLENRTIGGVQGHGPGEFGFVTDAVQDSQGNYYVAEYGDNDRIQKFDAQGNYLLQWGGPGEGVGQFRRPQNLAIDGENRIWVADSCNHRIQVFDAQGQFRFAWGEEGSEPGQLYYPYDLVLGEDETIYLCEFGNHRVQKFTWDGKLLGTWGVEGRAPGQLNNPWALVRDSRGRLDVVDSNNHRVQRVHF
jgi:DNA-binding beta-propeller fold protein YncE